MGDVKHSGLELGTRFRRKMFLEALHVHLKRICLCNIRSE